MQAELRRGSPESWEKPADRKPGRRPPHCPDSCVHAARPEHARKIGEHRAHRRSQLPQRRLRLATKEYVARTTRAASRMSRTSTLAQRKTIARPERTESVLARNQGS